MAKRESTQTKELEEFTKLTRQELKALDTEVKKAGGHEAYLILKRAIRVVDGQLRILQHEDGSMPYQKCSEELKQLDDYLTRKQAAEDYEEERLTGVNPRAERMRKIMQDARDITHSKNLNTA
ncbi:MAG: hypothetical protein M3P98_01480 [bacterium]|nr:hypothetical protein [bacterium]